MIYKNTAFLGPKGTNTENALKCFAPHAERVCCVSVAEVFAAVASSKVDSGFVALENVVEGPVTETLDLLLEYSGLVYVESSYIAEINHALGVLPLPSSSREAVNDFSRITSVMSHPQAISQCSDFLRGQLPHAMVDYADSSSAAATLIQERMLYNAAVITSQETLKDYGFETIAQNISNVANNRTRFAIIRKGDIRDPEKLILISDQWAFPDDRDFVTTIAINPKRDRQGLLLDILNVISVAQGINMVSIHSRPDSAGGFVFFLDLEGHPGQSRIRECLLGLQEYCRLVTGGTSELSILGAYEYTPFRKLRFKSIGIIGGKGVMGQWFSRFFAEIGYPVVLYDVDSSMTLAELSEQCDVLLISVPLSQSADVARDLVKVARSGQLIVENCSIKGCIHPSFEMGIAEGVEVLGVHTMFGGDIPSIKGEHVIITKTKASGERAQAFEDLLYKHGAMIVYSTANEHDQAVAYIQSLEHLLAIAIGDTLASEFASHEQIDAFSTRNSRQLEAIIGRIVKQSDSLIADLQMLNPQSQSARKRFLEILFKLVFALEYGDTSAVIESAKRARRLFAE